MEVELQQTNQKKKDQANSNFHIFGFRRHTRVVFMIIEEQEKHSKIHVNI